MEKFREKCRQEKAELATVQDALGKEFPQKAELALAHENNSAVIRELQRMQDDAGYVSQWTPKTLQNLTADMPKDGLAIAREDAERRGLNVYSSAEMTIPHTDERFPSRDNISSSFQARLEIAGFSPCNSDYYGKSEHELTLDAEDGGIYNLRVFQTGSTKIGLHVQYEKNHIINETRTVSATFDTLPKPWNM